MAKVRSSFSPIILASLVLVIGVGAYILYLDRTEKASPSPVLTTATPTVSTSTSPIATVTKPTLFLSRDGGDAVISELSSTGGKTEVFRYTLDPRDQPEATISDDSTKIVYADGNGNVNLYTVSTKKTTVLKSVVKPTNDSSSDGISFGNPVISPDGKYVVMAEYGWENASEAFASTDGSVSQNGIADCWAGDVAWASDSSHFAIAAPNEAIGATSCLYVATPQDPSKGKDYLPKDTQGNTKDAFTPSWSPDNSKIAFAYGYLGTDNSTQASSDANNQHRGIYVVNADGTGFTEVSANQSYSTAPIWKDNATIIYGLSNLYSMQEKGVYSINVNGTANKQLYSNELANYTPQHVLSDGKTLLFTADSDGVKGTDSGAPYTTKTLLLDLDSSKVTTVQSLDTTIP